MYMTLTVVLGLTISVLGHDDIEYDSFIDYVVKDVESRFTREPRAAWLLSPTKGIFLAAAREQPMETFCYFTFSDESVIAFEAGTSRTVVLTTALQENPAAHTGLSGRAFGEKFGAKFTFDQERTLFVLMVPKVASRRTHATVVDSKPDGTCIVRHYLLQKTINANDPKSNSYGWMKIKEVDEKGENESDQTGTQVNDK
ncbi:MAG: hypothetical protein NTX48_16900 [Planctomycetales bacterium]|nr:hypothetical protein [Planctomycetales bacterium]